MSDPTDPPVDLSNRDLTLDLTRVFCVLMVVAIHLLMIGVGFDGSGAIEATRPLEAQPWFAYATWVGQIMPLFFVVGGFASLTAWRSATRKGRTAADYIRTRVLRLARPALPLFVFYAVVITGVTMAGIAPELVATVFTGAGRSGSSPPTPSARPSCH
jgi:fucose 4-O-acetylase-like acetyltransferase